MKSVDAPKDRKKIFYKKQSDVTKRGEKLMEQFIMQQGKPVHRSKAIDKKEKTDYNRQNF